MPGGRKSAHVGSNLSDQRPSGQTGNTRNLAQPLDQVLIRQYSLTNALFQELQLAGEPVEFFDQFSE
jgi:hypothetical protein